MPTFPIVDAHVHLWDTTKLQYPWLEEEPDLNRPFLPEDYRKAWGERSPQVEKMVFVQCECAPEQSMEEARWVTELAKKDTRIRAIIPWAPLELGEGVRPILEELSGNPLIKGIRRIIEFENDMEFCLRPGFVRGVQRLSDFGMSFDINIDHTQMANTIRMVRQCPGVPFMLDHAGKPDIKNNRFDTWSRDLTELAAIPEVFCKISHLVNKADHRNWTVEDLKPFIYRVLECFGPDRVVFASDWPVCTAVAGIPQWVNALEQAVGHLPEDQLRKLFHDNAERFYRI